MKFEVEETIRGVTNEDLLEDIRRCANRIAQDSISMTEYEKIGRAFPSTVQRRFGSWNKALELAGLQPNKSKLRIADEELFENIKTLWIHLGRQPRSREIKAPDSKFQSTTYKRRFGSWSKALHEFVIWVSSDSPDHPPQDLQTRKFAVDSMNPPVIVKPRTLREISDRQRFRILVRDGFRCKSCGKSPLTQPGTLLHVDHILPWSKGGETIDANLESKCEQCNLGKGNAFEV